MAKLTDLLKKGDVKYLTRECWLGNGYCATVIKVDVDMDEIVEFTWWSEDGDIDFNLETAEWKTTTLELNEALADDWLVMEIPS